MKEIYSPDFDPSSWVLSRHSKTADQKNQSTHYCRSMRLPWGHYYYFQNTVGTLLLLPQKFREATIILSDVEMNTPNPRFPRPIINLTIQIAWSKQEYHSCEQDKSLERRLAARTYQSQKLMISRTLSYNNQTCDSRQISDCKNLTCT